MQIGILQKSCRLTHRVHYKSLTGISWWNHHGNLDPPSRRSPGGVVGMRWSGTISADSLANFWLWWWPRSPPSGVGANCFTAFLCRGILKRRGKKKKKKKATEITPLSRINVSLHKTEPSYSLRNGNALTKLHSSRTPPLVYILHQNKINSLNDMLHESQPLK